MPRGGGVSGFCVRASAKKSVCGKSRNCIGATRTNRSGAGGKSSFFSSSVKSDFFSESFRRPQLCKAGRDVCRRKFLPTPATPKRTGDFREHCRPRDRLQRGPMRARRREQRGNHQNLAEADEHAGKLNLQSESASVEIIRWGERPREPKWLFFKMARGNARPTRSHLRNPHQRAAWQQIKKRNQIRVSEMDAAAGSRFANARLIRRAVDVDVARA